MPQEQFPLYLKGIVIRFLFGYPGPTFKEIYWLLNIRIPDRLRRIPVMLDIALPETGNSRTFCTVNLKCQKVVPSLLSLPRRN